MLLVVETLKAMERRITDLHFDLLKIIMILVVKSSDGAANLARAISVCTEFMQLAEDTDVLKAVCFDNVSVSNRYALFQQTNGLLYRCAQVGNEAAQFLLTKIILMSSSQLLVKIKRRERIQTFSRGRGPAYKACRGRIPREDALAATFLAHFVPGQACSSTASDLALPHWEFVRKFLCHGSARDLTEMQAHLNCYIDYFTERGSSGNLLLHHFINKMCNSAFRVRASEEVSLEEVRANFIERIRALNEREQLRQNNLPQKAKLDAVLEATMRFDDDFGEEFTEEEWLGRNFAETPNLGVYLGVRGFGGDCSNAVSLFEECRINALDLFDHVFP